MRVYISGAITGVKHADKLFARAEEKLELEVFTIGVLGVLLRLKAHLNKE